ncbi:MAG: 50S ribosomal protein L32 [Deltaproteobacteria bacterium]|nr:MAG: 50S ribosomal protein L32 [Deltaproteobacteria bacterium]
MALQKRRLGRSRVRHRRSAWAASFKKPLVGTCPKCGAPRLPHRVCLECGTYRGEQVVEGRAEDTE